MRVQNSEHYQLWNRVRRNWRAGFGAHIFCCPVKTRSAPGKGIPRAVLSIRFPKAQDRLLKD